MRTIAGFAELAAFDMIPAAIWVFDVDRHGIWWANEAGLGLWRAETVEELRNRDFSDDTPAIRDRLAVIFDNTPDGSCSTDTWTIYPGGVPVTASANITPVRIGPEGGRGLLVNVTAANPEDPGDPTSRRLLEAARYSRTIVRTFSSDGRLLSQNPAAALVFSSEDSANVIDMFDDPDVGRRIVAEAHDGLSGWYEELVCALDGKRWYRLNSQPSIDPVTGRPAIVVSGEDITEARSLLHRLEAINSALERRVEVRTGELVEALNLATLARAEAEEANKAKSTFLAQMSHDLRTPLNAIMGMSDLMRSEMFGPIGERYKSYAEDVLSAATHLLALINDLLDLSKIEAGAIEPSVGEFPVWDVLTEARDLALRSVKGDCTTIEISSVGDATFTSDRRMIYQVLLNLLSNARRFTPVDGVITVEADVRDHVMTLVVRDTGTGIAADKLEQVLQPYRQGDPATADPNEGTGLGLAIVHGMSRVLGGDTRIRSTPGKGTEVTVTFREPGSEVSEQISL
jgi:signal transduction histidine kinase